ncbi:MAG: HoxN/HupN/NixA family nickel/cobalt transporter [Lactobacillus sp.]|jgi:high-affinity nickel-transport protein|nr:HoxN/HupN/NixA family nickel/cobalt transporter [Lactobacillus sp.]
MKQIRQSLPYYGVIGLLHLLGFLGLAIACRHYPGFWAIGILAYMLGLRHAFDADHIAAIDNTVRKLIQQDQKTVGVGFYFSLGHSTVVLLMSITVGLSINWVSAHLPVLQKVGGLVGSFVSGIFLILVAIFNLVVLWHLVKSIRQLHNKFTAVQNLDDLLAPKGVLTTLLKPLFKFIKHSWQMYPIGFLFGLGFDTATEITLLALTAQSSQRNLPLIGIIALPIIFTAGMSLMDTTDAVMMSGAYKWAFDTPIRKAYYNIVITSVSVLAAISIGVVELLQVTGNLFNFKGLFWHWLQAVDFNWLGFGLVAAFMLLWLVAYGIWRSVIAKKYDTPY